jgi:ribosomal protein S18 acetylase RimI-like enzyme
MPDFEPVPREHLAGVLRILLAEPGDSRPAERTRVRSFADYLARSDCHWEVFRGSLAGRTRALLLVLLIPGDTAVLMLPNAGDHAIDAAAQVALIDWWRDRYSPEAFCFEQALIETNADGKRASLEQLHFKKLTRLIYLDRSTVFPRISAARRPDVDFVTVSQAGQAALARVLSASYQDSLDCPELNGLRPIDSVIAAHRSTGVYDPELWELVRVAGRDAGCLLLSQLPNAPVAEVVYMGVGREFRRKGLGEILLHRALEHSHARQARRLTLVVDERNAPARGLYQRFGFGRVAERDAYLRVRRA